MSRPDLLQHLAARTAERERAGLRRRLRAVEHARGTHITINGRELLAFCSNDYLGLARHPKVIAALREAANEYGAGATAAHLICGHHREHAALEEELAEWMQRERALLFSSGWLANLGAMQALLDGEGVCVQDKLNHASLLDAAKLSGATLRRYQHADCESAARQLAGAGDLPALLATDGVFSMAEAPVLMATLGKALGTAGAFVAGNAALIEGLTQFARTYVYTTAQPPSLAAATRAAVRIARTEAWRREKLNALIERFRAGAQQLGLPLAESHTPIQPILLGDAEATVRTAGELESAGVLVGAIRPPSVPANGARLRITFSAAHEEADVDRLLDALAKGLSCHGERATKAASSL